jgi:hypothetical protein
MNGSYVVQILVPTETGKGEPVSKEWFDKFLQELTDKFGGATSFVRAWTRPVAKRRYDRAGHDRGHRSDGREARPGILAVPARTAPTRIVAGGNRHPRPNHPALNP